MLFIDGTVTRDGVTLGQNSDQMFTNASGSEFIPRQTVGSHYGLSVNAALLGGFGFGGGIVNDATGKSSVYFTFNGNIGFGGGVGLDIGKNAPTGSNQFYKEDFEGNSGSYNLGISTPIVDFGYGYGGSLDSHVGGVDALKPKNFGANKNGYKTEQLGLSPGTGFGASVMYSFGKTWVY